MGESAPEIVAEAGKPLGLDKLKSKLDKKKEELDKVIAERVECGKRMQELQSIAQKLVQEIERLKADIQAQLGL